MFRIVVEVSRDLAYNERSAEEYITKALERYGPQKREGTSEYYWRRRIKSFSRVMVGLAAQGKRMQEASEFISELNKIGGRLLAISVKLEELAENKQESPNPYEN